MSEKKGIIEAIRQKGKNLEAEMSFFDHLEVLRWHLIRAAIAVLLFMFVSYWFYDWIFNTLIMGPTHTDFWTYRMLCILSRDVPSLFANSCVKEFPFEIINTELAGQFTLQLNSSLMIGVILGVPYFLYEIWKFISPGLTEKERGSATGFVFFASCLFLMGVLFGYFIICPMSINFLATFTVSSSIKNMYSIDSYLSTVSTLTIGSGIVFELPIVIYILSKLGIMTPKFMRATRRYSTIIILIIAAVVTPTPDIVTMMTVALPLFLLYEFSIIISSRVEKKKEKNEAEFYSN